METIIDSSYYDEPILIDHKDALTMLNIYNLIARDHKFESEAHDIYDMLNSSSVFDHVLYHVENFGKGYLSYNTIRHYFEEEE